ncbi:MAG: hypothetical protein CVU04_03025 [Bacteroidetes bacterium HGW-Bacteroidetes-20]|nr:MAG: hypothetical protein CVU04_03025 [Bacteroidetes bacterium HGW-Bacteroidetes-20]
MQHIHIYKTLFIMKYLFFFLFIINSYSCFSQNKYIEYKLYVPNVIYYYLEFGDTTKIDTTFISMITPDGNKADKEMLQYFDKTNPGTILYTVNGVFILDSANYDLKNFKIRHPIYAPKTLIDTERNYYRNITIVLDSQDAIYYIRSKRVLTEFEIIEIKESIGIRQKPRLVEDGTCYISIEI